MRSMKDQQHTFQALLWVASGALGRVLLRRGLVCGVHMLVPYAATAFMMAVHSQHQSGEHAALAHAAHGALMLAAGLLRFSGAVAAYSLVRAGVRAGGRASIVRACVCVCVCVRWHVCVCLCVRCC